MLRKPGQRLRPDRPRLARMQPFLIYKSNFTVEPLYLAPIFLEETARGRFQNRLCLLVGVRQEQERTSVETSIYSNTSMLATTVAHDKAYYCFCCYTCPRFLREHGINACLNVLTFSKIKTNYVYTILAGCLVSSKQQKSLTGTTNWWPRPLNRGDRLVRLCLQYSNSR